MFKELDTIILKDSRLDEDIILAKKLEDVWLCQLCPTEMLYRVKMLDHCRLHVELA